MSRRSNLNPYQELANAIVVLAAKDYTAAVKKLDRGRKNEAAQRTKDECLHFFRSAWFGRLTEIDPEFLIKKLNSEVTAR